jgi:3-deoxy-D-manno-octulosonate 8-phosphate phosphatase KdsC-like HAD superfamily phosphatase
VCGHSFAPADAVDEVLARARVVCRTVGGGGVLREVAERILAMRSGPA